MAGNFWKSSHYEQWILDKQDLYRQRGEDIKIIGEEEYHKIMIFFINYIQAMGNQLGSRQQMIATASVYFRRFYARRSLKDIDPFLLSISCLHLAAKVDEHGNTSPSKLSNAANQLAKMHPCIPPDDGRMSKLITEVEFYLLEIMDCCLIVYHPYRTALQLFSDLKLKESDDKLKRDTYGLMNDSLKTDACLLFAPHQIAIACLLGATINNNKEDEMRPWFQELAVDYDSVFEILRMITSAYKRARSVDISHGHNNNENIKSLLAKIPKPNPPSSTNQNSNQSMMQQFR
uniref:Cyclin-like domain-containing protein n=2 Tax=Panagrolaimus TaxID=55784 RepID=A0A914Q4G7_9BILA